MLLKKAIEEDQALPIQREEYRCLDGRKRGDMRETLTELVQWCWREKDAEYISEPRRPH